MLIKKIRELTEEEEKKIICRNKSDLEDIMQIVSKILNDVKKNGDRAVKHYTKKFDGVELEELRVSREEIEEAYNLVDYKVIEAIEKAKENIIYFHKKQMEQINDLEVKKDGIILGQTVRAIENVGCYVPGGRAFYPSTVLMTTIPAKVAGCKHIVITSPPTKEGKGNPATLIAGDIVGVDEIFKVGGVQAIGALAYGTETIPKVDIIVGPGNIYVTVAKKLVYGEVAIDFLAGPSEVLIIADETANAEFVALDFIAQAEHDPNASCVITTTSEDKALEIKEKILEELNRAERKEIINSALKNSAILIGSLEECINFSNKYAPEHLEILTKNPEDILKKIDHAGSVFLGEYSPVPVGDYASGTNHVLPTSQFARMSSGLNVETFLKKITYQKLDKESLKQISDIVITLAEAEGLFGHAEAVRRRILKK
ncbi:histidinol dehydrogenase [Methanocaldococcus vulcanius M7]|uniref:Histidinol dehydrogenase n=1 Tax=Methanocaldococcus vulcanius (strain ATCC 700851 / DSM 12094 / M7) TaxID=579137 RepID=C9RI95_METVM|nr:histidinol dehydrogenase [Methanocaldococcus vulcanius]ACX73297.1 histidinol dehydrogenase [Methanocaldococcus vulcanius M7]